MPKVHWLDVPRTSEHCFVTAVVPSSDDESPVSPRLKESINLIARVCSALSLRGRYALEGTRTEGTEVRIIFEFGGDAQRFAEAAGVAVPLQGETRFVLDDGTVARLETVGGVPDFRNKGRRRFLKEQAMREGLSWASRPFGPVVQRRDSGA